MIKINAIGDVCPIPVIKVKNAIKELGGKGVIEITVDNEIAVQNLTKMAQQKNIQIVTEKISNQEYKATFTLDEQEQECGCRLDTDAPISGDTVVVISADTMGNGDDVLGKLLLKSFIFALTKCDRLPQTIIFYNKGAFITAEGSESLEDLKYLESQGVEISTCGTCINHYGLSPQPPVGSVSNMYFIAEKLMNAGGLIRP